MAKPTVRLKFVQASFIREMLRSWKTRRRIAKQHRQAEVFIVSFPKSGRTWLKVLIGKILCDKYCFDKDLMLEFPEITRLAKLPRTIFTNDEVAKSVDYKVITQRYKKKKVVLLIRDPRDVLVSNYFQRTRRIISFGGTISEFIRDETYGLKKNLIFLNSWYNYCVKSTGDNQLTPADFLVIRYEEIHNQPKEVINAVLKFMKVPGVSKDALGNAICFAQFENMKKLETTHYFNNAIMQPGHDDDCESYKVRKGIIGGFSDYLSTEDLKYIDSVIAEVGCPFYPELSLNRVA